MERHNSVTVTNGHIPKGEDVGTGFSSSQSADASKMSTDQRKVLLILFAILVLDLLAFTCILPLFPSLLDFYASEGHRVSFTSNDIGVCS